jgi:serine phosphatase RsbU (regulator of sigma subunit)/anti-sigma regulatory factor (Ser/Thr protein kinase)/ABC-type transporter Mla MlaB component
MLRGVDDRLLAAFEQAPAALFVFEGPDHIVVGANRIARGFTGDRPNLIGVPLRRALPELEGQQIFELIDEAYRSGQVINQPERRVLVDRNGDGSLEEGFFAYTFVPAQLPSGTRGIVVHATETTSLVRQRQSAEQRYREARDVVLALQEHLLPPGVPVLPAVRLAARYVVAGRDTAAGGDLFDAVPLNDGRVVLMVGDVVGHGAPAAATMGQLRAVALQALSSGAGLVETVLRLGGLAARLRSAQGATMCLVELDPRSGDLRYVNCAHPAPLILDAQAGVRYLAPVEGLPLGVGQKPPSIGTDRLLPGQQLLLYSDGLVERAGRTLSDGLADLARVALAAHTDPVGPDTSLPELLLDRVCALVIERLGTQGYGDDVTLLAAELLPEPRPGLRLRLPAHPDRLSGIRRSLRGWLAGLDTGPDDVSALLHAVDEACTNVIEHAYPAGVTGTVQVDADVADTGVVEVQVTDQGQWRPPSADPGSRGRGLMLMRGLVEAVHVARLAGGTTVRLRHPLWRPVAVGTAPVDVAAPDAGAVPFAAELIRSEQPTLRVHGPVDQVTVADLRMAILDAGRGGGLALTLDLSAVTHLASAGLQLLHELDAAAEGSAGFHVMAPADSGAHQVLLLSGLGHRCSSAG